jgi:EAL domain-containing protein (putative c-di-GMP-specific phosphodiesterase class I)
MDSTRGARILIAEDEAEQRELLELVLVQAGYRVAAAPDGAVALRLIEQERFDVVVSDIKMPGLDGIQLLHAIRKRDLDLPVILLTGDPDLASAARAVNEGALRYLTKPTGPSLILREVDNAVRLHGMARLKRDALQHLGYADKLLGDKASLTTAFARAIEAVWLAYQPIFRADGSRYGYEALVRCDVDPLRAPPALIDAAERLDRMIELGRLLRARIASLIASRPDLCPIFVNLHPSELDDEQLYHPAGAFARHAGSVVLEITERASIDDISEVRSRVRRLKDLGFRVAVDDLGAGYAGLSTFAALEPDVVKLDMSLVRSVDAEPIRKRLVRSMIEVCRESGILVVAEGIETEAERDTLVELKCDLLQGFLLGRPGKVEALAGQPA